MSSYIVIGIKLGFVIFTWIGLVICFVPKEKKTTTARIFQGKNICDLKMYFTNLILPFQIFF